MTSDGNPKAGFNLPQERGVKCQQLAATLDTVGADHPAAILGEGHSALGLAPISLDHRRDRAHAGKRGVEHSRVDPLLARLAAQLGQPFCEGVGGGKRGRDRKRQGAGERGERHASIGRTHVAGWLPISMSAIA